MHARIRAPPSLFLVFALHSHLASILWGRSFLFPFNPARCGTEAEKINVSRSRRNIVATVNLDCKLDLKTIAFHARNVEYNPKVRETLKKRQ